MKLPNLLVLLLLTALPLQAGIEFDLPSAGNNDKHLLEFHWKNEVPANRKAHPNLKHRSYHSESNNAEVGYFLYTPEGYSDPKNANKRYPVVYHLHGGRPGNEGKNIAVFPLLLKAIREGDRPDTFIVFVNGGRVSHYDWQGYNGATAFLELVQHMDAAYRSIPDRKGRFLQGSSQGGRGVTRYLLRHPDLFCAALSMAAGHQGELKISENNGVEGQFITMDHPEYNTWDLARAYAANPNNPKINLMIAIGDKDSNYKSNLLYHVFLNDLGIDNELVIARGVGHGLKFNLPEAGPRMLAFPTTIFRENGVID